MTPPEPQPPMTDALSPDPAGRSGRIVRIIVGWLLVVVGGVLTPTPVPLGLPMLAAGLYLLARDSATVRRGIRRRRKALPMLSRGLDRIKGRMPAGVRGMIEATDPAGPLPQED